MVPPVKPPIRPLKFSTIVHTITLDTGEMIEVYINFYQDLCVRKPAVTAVFPGKAMTIETRFT